MENVSRQGHAQKFFQDVVLPYDGDECLYWPYARSGGRYAVMMVGGRGQGVHRLVCQNIHGPAPTTLHQAAHSCGNGHLGCVNGKHLSWKTSKGNINDKFSHGTMLIGERALTAKLSELQVREILSLKGKKSIRALGREFGVAKSTICSIHTGKRWKWVEPELTL